MKTVETIIPDGTGKEDIKARERIIKDFYAEWIKEHPEKKIWNINLQDYIMVKNQKPYSKLLIMTYEDIKLTVGVQKSTQEKVQYCLTSIRSNKSK